MSKKIQEQIDDLREQLNVERAILQYSEEDKEWSVVEECKANIKTIEAELARLTGVQETRDADA